MINTDNNIHVGKWLTSKEAKQKLKVSDCHLMHMRLAGQLQFRKESNRFFYLIPAQTKK